MKKWERHDVPHYSLLQTSVSGNLRCIAVGTLKGFAYPVISPVHLLVLIKVLFIWEKPKHSMFWVFNLVKQLLRADQSISMHSFRYDMPYPHHVQLVLDVFMNHSSDCFLWHLDISFAIIHIDFLGFSLMMFWACHMNWGVLMV